MLYYIRFSDKIKKMLIDHAFQDPMNECGGFLCGRVSSDSEAFYYDIDGIYYEKIKGTDHEFKFGLLYINRAMQWIEANSGESFIGTYHSHGQHDAILSDIDHNELQRHFGSNKVTIVYSPKYSRFVGEILTDDGISHRAKILTRQ